MNRQGILIVLSALLFTLALHVPQCCMLIFCSMIPIFYSALTGRPTFWHGLLWGVIVYGTHFFVLFPTLATLSHNNSWALLPLLVVFYFSFFVGCYFFISQRIAEYFVQPIAKLCAWVIGTFCYITFIHFYSLPWIQMWCGYGLVHPLLTLAHDERFFGAAIPMWFLLLCLLIAQASITYFLFVKNTIWLLGCLSLLPFFIGFITKKGPAYTLLVKNTYVNLHPAKGASPFDRAQEITRELYRVLVDQPHVEIIILPESAFPYPLNEMPFVVNWWLPVTSNVHLFIGSHRKEDGRIYNTLYHIYQGAIVDWYDKQRLVPVIEYVPFFLQWLPPSGNDLFNDCKPFTAGSDRKKLFYVNGLILRPLICSDLFFNTSMESLNGEFVLFIMNITPFTCNYFKELLLRFVNLSSFALR